MLAAAPDESARITDVDRSPRLAALPYAFAAAHAPQEGRSRGQRLRLRRCATNASVASRSAIKASEPPPIAGICVAGVRSTSATLSSPLLSSVAPSPFSKAIVIVEPEAVTVSENVCQTRLVVLGVELVSVKVGTPSIDTLTVLVVPKIEPPDVLPMA